MVRRRRSEMLRGACARLGAGLMKFAAGPDMAGDGPSILDRTLIGTNWEPSHGSSLDSMALCLHHIGGKDGARRGVPAALSAWPGDLDACSAT